MLRARPDEKDEPRVLGSSIAGKAASVLRSCDAMARMRQDRPDARGPAAANAIPTSRRPIRCGARGPRARARPHQDRKPDQPHHVRPDDTTRRDLGDQHAVRVQHAASTLALTPSVRDDRESETNARACQSVLGARPRGFAGLQFLEAGSGQQRRYAERAEVRKAKRRKRGPQERDADVT